MIRLARFARRFRAAAGGAAIVEFALVATPFLMLLMGLLDLGFREYVSVMLDGALTQAARQVTVGGVSQNTIQTYVAARMATVVPAGTAVVTPKTYYDYTGMQTMEPITTDQNNNGQLDSGDCFLDYNGNGTRDTNGGVGVANPNGTIGSSEDIVYYTAQFTYTSFVPVTRLLGWSGNESVTSTTMVRNQPFGAQATPSTVCMP